MHHAYDLRTSRLCGLIKIDKGNGMKYNLLPIIAFIFVLGACSSSKKITKVDDSSTITDYSTSEYVGPKKKIAIAKFENATRFGKRRLGENMTSVLTTELSKTKRFILLERADVDKILDQLALSQSGITEGSLEQIRLLDADFILTGQVTHYAVTTTGSSNLFTQSKTQKAEVGADIRIIDVRTGEILLSESGKGTTEKEFDKVLGMGEDGGYDESLEMDAFRIAVIELTKNIVQSIDQSPWICDVVKISDSRLYIDAGKMSNLSIGMVMQIFQKGEAVKNLSGKVIGYEEKMVGSGTISEFFGNDGAILTSESNYLLSLPLFCRLAESDEQKQEK
jgi:curli biogenesis system outer membrane secretion channel CsgG